MVRIAALSQNHVLNMVAAGRLDLSTPLRWHGRLRDELVELPWGTSFDLALDSVEFEETPIPIVGGMRLAYSPRGDSVQLPLLHSGDVVSLQLRHFLLPILFRVYARVCELN